MRRSLLLLSALSLALAAVGCKVVRAQAPPSGGFVVYQSGAPSGTCNLPNFLTVATQGTQAGLYQCLGVPLTWTQVSITGGGTGSSGITQLTGDGSAGPGFGSVLFTLATVITPTGPCGDATHVCQVTYDNKGRITSVASVAITGGGGGSGPGGSSGQGQWNNAGSFAGYTTSGDCTQNFSTGVITCTKTGGALFAASATTDTTNAGNINSGTLPAARLPNPSATTLGGIESVAATTNNYIDSISTVGVPHVSRPSFANLSGNLGAAQGPTTINGLVKDDGAGNLSTAAANTDYLTPGGSATGLSKASNTAFGVSECDGTTITCIGGIFTAVSAGSGVSLQTNGVANASQSTLNLITSSVDAAGLTVTPSNSTSTVKFEITGTANNAAKWATPRLLAGNSVDGSANVPFANKVIAQGTTDTGLPNAQFLGSLATGPLCNTTTTGVLTVCGSTSLANPPMFVTLPNNAAGTTNGLLACWSQNSFPQTDIKTCPTAASNGTDSFPPIVGVVIAGGGTTGSATVQFAGAVSWVSDGQTFVNEQVQPSVITAGQGHDPHGGGAAIQPNENPEANSMLGRVLAANTGTGTASIVQLLIYPGYANLVGANSYGQFMLSMGQGSPFQTASYWSQEPTTHALMGAPPIHLYTCISCWTDIEGNSTLGSSGQDSLIDTLSHQRVGNGVMLRIKGSTYNVPTVATVTGTQTPIMGTTSGVFVWTLSGNTTLAAPTFDNAGHVVTFDIIQAASGGPFTFTWNSVFKNPPTVSAVAGAITVAQFFFDGTNYTCIGGCPTTGTGTVTHTGGALANNAVMLGAGGADSKTDTVATSDGAGNMTFASESTTGVAGTAGGRDDVQGTTQTNAASGHCRLQALTGSHYQIGCNAGAFNNVMTAADVIPTAQGGTNTASPAFTTQTDAATVTWNTASALLANASLTFTVHGGSRTLNVSNMVNGGSYVIWLKQDSTGGEGLALGTGCIWKVSGGGAGAITPSTGANAVDVLAFTYDGTNCYANFNTNFN
jgi:hypothetical protein